MRRRAASGNRAALVLIFLLPVVAINGHTLVGQAPQEDARARAVRLTTEAGALAQQNDAQSLKRALPLRQEALAIFTTLGDRAAQAENHHGLGNIHERLNDLPRAREAFETALAIRRELGDPRGQAETLSRVGAVYRAMGAHDLALDAYTRGLEFAKETGDVRREAVLLSNLGVLYATTGDNARAREFLTRARQAYQAAKDRLGEASTMTSLAVVSIALNDSTTALELYHESLITLRELGDRRRERTTLHNMGVAYDVLGDAPRAIEYYTQSLALARELGDRRAEASTLTSYGLLLRRLGDPRKSAEYLEQAVRALDELKIPLEHGRALNYLGRAYEALGEYDKAFAAYARALPLNRQAGDRQDQAATLKSMGGAYTEVGELAQARLSLDEARRLYQEIGDTSGEADVWAVSARASMREGKLDDARRYIDNALALVESVRARINIPAFRATSFSPLHAYYGVKIELLMRLHAEAPTAGHAAEAFLTSEKSRARALLETVNNAGVRGGGEAAAGEARLRTDINRKATARLTATGSQAKQLDQELETLVREYEVLQGRIREARPGYASLSTGLDRLEDLQRLLDADTALVEYSMGTDRSFAWVVTSQGFRAVALAKAAEIETAAREYFELVTSRPQRALRVRQRQAAETLSKLVVAPIGDALRRKRLLVVSDGALHYVPFAALPEPNRGGADRQPVPLVTGHEIVQLPSAAVLTRLRARQTTAARADKTLAVFADPVFRPDDPRVNGAPAGAASQLSSTVRGGDLRIPTTDDLVKAMTDTELPRLDRLPSSAREADAIVALAGRESTLRAVGFDAQRKLVLSPTLARYRVVHFATHGLLNSRRPELSGLVLSFVDADREPQDGFVGLTDILNLQLNAELVVLSACRTALGRDVKGEGLVGLTRGFMSAGVPRVVSTLWDVQDESTVHVMTRFYRGVLKQGQSPAAALRAAQLAMRADPRWSEPYYWAAFTFQGDWSRFLTPE